MSSSSSNPQWIYDVFVNFRGEDTRSNFVSHLHAAFSNAGINAFVDHQLHKGMELGPELLRAIEGSHVSIVVFSNSYTESSWCLLELEQIIKCSRTYGQVVIPIFYDVDPSVVRHLKGNFGKVLQATAKRSTLQGERMEYVLSRWKNAVNEATNLSGWDARNCRSEAELVNQIVEAVLTKVDSTFLSITDFPVGLEYRVQKVVEFIEKQSSKVCTIGIWGMGGSGKTTTAKAIYNRIHRTFVDRSFIESIREVCENDNRGIIHLQEQLLSDVLKTKEKIHSIASGTHKIEKRLSGKRALIVLDDVTEFEQLKQLCKSPKLFGSGSLLIVTTRDVHLLDLLNVDYVYTTKEMDRNESLELFSWHAFKKASPIKGFTELSKNVVAYCGGLPLALEVLGSYLHGRINQEWKSVLSKLERIPDGQVHETLRISYDGLKDDTVKDIFLDICFFFIGKDRAYVADILDGCGFYAHIGITVLIERSLVKVEKNNKLQMHALIRDMGREIVRQSSVKKLEKRSRLWFHEDVQDVLTKNTGTEAVEGLVLKSQRTSRVCFSTDSFEKMKKLRLLHLDRVDLMGDYGHLSEQLRWVNWQGFTLKCIPDDFYKGNVVAIDLKYSNIKQVWKETKLLEKLKFLNLSHSKNLKITPDFSLLPNLEKLILKDCPSLSEVHQSIGDLCNIHLINLKDCTSLTNLPRKFYQLKSLKTLNLSGCSKIDKLEEDILQMESLTTLIAKDTAIKEVPYSIITLKSVGYISLCGYEGLSRDVFPFLIWSWMSPKMNSLPYIPPLDLGYPSPMLSNLSKSRSFHMEFHSEIQLNQALRKFLDDLYDANVTELEKSHASQILARTHHSFHLIVLGTCDIDINTLSKGTSQGLSSNDSSDPLFLGDNFPSWLAYKCEGPSVLFQIPGDSDCHMKGICIVYSSTPESTATECLTSVLIINYTKLTVQIFRQDTIMSFNDEDWQGVVSSFGVGDNVEILVAFGHVPAVKETCVYLIYGQSKAMEIEPSITMEVGPSPEVILRPSPVEKVQPSFDVNESLPEVNVQPAPDVKMESSPIEEVQPSPNVKMEPSLNVKDPLPEVNVQPSPIEEVQPSPNVKMEPSLDVKESLAEVNVQPSPYMKMEPTPMEEVEPSPDVKMEPSHNVKESLPMPNKTIFTRLAKRMGTCLCLNQKKGSNNF